MTGGGVDGRNDQIMVRIIAGCGDLRRLVLYTSRPDLKPLIHVFGSGDGLSAMVEKAITFGQTQDCMGELLAEVKEANPRQYARFETRLLA